jgi:hypothetical protein
MSISLEIGASAPSATLPGEGDPSVYRINRLRYLARLLHNNYCNYETRDTISPVSGALTDPRLLGACHSAAALPAKTSHALRKWGISQTASSGDSRIRIQVSSDRSELGWGYG